MEDIKPSLFKVLEDHVQSSTSKADETQADMTGWCSLYLQAQHEIIFTMDKQLGFEYSGNRVIKVHANSQAEIANIKEGWFIIAINGTKGFHNYEDIRAVIATTKEKGGKMTIEFSETTNTLNSEPNPSNIEFLKFFFVLKCGSLRYYSDDKLTVEEGNINLEDLNLELCDEAKYGRKFCFQLSNANKNPLYVIMEENNQNITKWMTSIRRSKLRIRRSKVKESMAEKKQEKFTEEKVNKTTDQLGLQTPNLEQNKRYNIYNQWLEEAKLAENESDGTLKRTLLDDGYSRERHICCGKIRWRSNSQPFKCDCCCILL